MLTLGDYPQKHMIILIRTKGQKHNFPQCLSLGSLGSVRQILEYREFL